MDKIYTCFECGKTSKELDSNGNCNSCHSRNFSMQRIITQQEEIVYREYRRKTDLSNGDGIAEPLSMQKSFNKYYKTQGGQWHDYSLVNQRLSRYEEIKRNVPFLREVMDYLLEDK